MNTPSATAEQLASDHYWQHAEPAPPIDPFYANSFRRFTTGRTVGQLQDEIFELSEYAQQNCYRYPIEPETEFKDSLIYTDSNIQNCAWFVKTVIETRRASRVLQLNERVFSNLMTEEEFVERADEIDRTFLFGGDLAKTSQPNEKGRSYLVEKSVSYFLRGPVRHPDFLVGSQSSASGRLVTAQGRAQLLPAVTVIGAPYKNRHNSQQYRIAEAEIILPYRTPRRRRGIKRRVLDRIEDSMTVIPSLTPAYVPNRHQT